MAFTQLTAEVENISQLSDTPNDEYTATELKAIFDLAGKTIKEYINSTLLSELGGTNAAGNIGIDPIEGLGTADTIQAAIAALLAIVQQAQQGTVLDGSITTAKLANNSVTTSKLGVKSVTHTNIADNTIKAQNIDSLAITNQKIADGAVDDDKIAAAAVTAAKLAISSVITEKIADLAVTATKLAAGAVTTEKINNGAVTNAKCDFSAGFNPAGAISLQSDVHYFASAEELPEATGSGRIAFVKV